MKRDPLMTAFLKWVKASDRCADLGMNATGQVDEKKYARAVRARDKARRLYYELKGETPPS